MISRHDLLRVGRLIPIAALLLLGACAEPPPPTGALRSAGDAIARAEENGAQQLAPSALQMAQNKLNAAEANLGTENYDVARRQAEEADVDAQYADASANAQRVANTAGELTGAQQRLQMRLRQQP